MPIRVTMVPHSFILLSLVLLLVGCPAGEKAVPAPLPLPERLTWEGRSPLTWVVDSGPRVADPAEPGVRGKPSLRRHIVVLQEGDTLILDEFARDDHAYQAFQAQAEAWEIREGAYRDDSGLVFFHGPFLGRLRTEDPERFPSSFLRERLAFQDEELFQRPRVFLSFPVAGQVPFTERVVSADFLGPGAAESVYLMRYLCRGDTAALFRGSSQDEGPAKAWLSTWSGQVDTLKRGREMRFSGKTEFDRPLEFWIFKGGFVGVEGCFDRKLAQEYVEKMRKMTILMGEP